MPIRILKTLIILLVTSSVVSAFGDDTKQIQTVQPKIDIKPVELRKIKKLGNTKKVEKPTQENKDCPVCCCGINFESCATICRKLDIDGIIKAKERACEIKTDKQKVVCEDFTSMIGVVGAMCIDLCEHKIKLDKFIDDQNNKPENKPHQHKH